MHRPLHRRGFTIIEAIVVIAIIATLAGLLIPSLSAIKRSMRNTTCMNNLRQFVAADCAYLGIHDRFPEMSPFVPSSTPIPRLRQIGKYFNLPVPPGEATEWPQRADQPEWFNCPCAIHSGFAEGPTVGGGVYTGYAYYGGLAQSQLVRNGLGTPAPGCRAADIHGRDRGVLWADILTEFPTVEERRYEAFHLVPGTGRHEDFRFFAGEVDEINRGWSDGSVDHALIRLTPNSPDLQLQTMLGNYYF